MSEWKECKLGDVVSSNNQSITNGYPYKTIQYLDTGSITEGKIEGYQEYNISDAPSRAKRLIKNNDIVYSTVRPIQRHYGFIIDPPKNFVVSTGFSVIETNRAIAEPLFVYYFLISDEIVETLDVIADGSTSAYPSLKPSDIENLDLILPPLPEQRAIASVLSRLDDKIDLLHRQNKILEALAETLFRQWFVEEAEEGWEEKTISDIIEVRDGTHDSPKPNEIGYFLITSKHLKSEGIDFKNAYKISEDDYVSINKRSKVNKNDILFSMIGTLGLICYVQEEPDYAIKNIGLFRSSQKPEFAKFLYLLLKSPLGKKFIYESADGSTQEYISLGSLREFEFKYPGDDVIKSFDKMVTSYFEKTFSNNNQIRTLARLRDTLLPKLMSGEVRVKLEEEEAGI